MPATAPRPSSRKYWFPAKTHGWGWGIPCTWQGWVVLAVYLALLVAGTRLIGENPLGALVYVGYALALSVALIAICWWKGEPPRWRWGDD